MSSATVKPSIVAFQSETSVFKFLRSSVDGALAIRASVQKELNRLLLHGESMHSELRHVC